MFSAQPGAEVWGCVFLSCVAKDNDWDAGDGDLQMGLQAALGGRWHGEVLPTVVRRKACLALEGAVLTQ